MTVLDEATLAEARSFNEALAEVLAEEPQVHTVPPERSRRARSTAPATSRRRATPFSR
jgi:hypothetical protein